MNAIVAKLLRHLALPAIRRGLKSHRLRRSGLAHSGGGVPRPFLVQRRQIPRLDQRADVVVVHFAPSLRADGFFHRHLRVGLRRARLLAGSACVPIVSDAVTVAAFVPSSSP